MAVRIPTYESERRTIDTDRGGVRVQTGGFQSMASAFKGLGSALASAGARAQAQAEQKEVFNANAQWGLFKQQQQTAWAEAQRAAPEDGAGLHDGFVGGWFQPKSQEFLDQLPERLRPKYESALAIEAERTSRTAAQAELGIRDNWYAVKITDQQNALLSQLADDPSSYKEVMTMGEEAIGTAGLSPAVKAKMEREWRRNVGKVLGQGLIKLDPNEALRLMGGQNPDKMSSRRKVDRDLECPHRFRRTPPETLWPVACRCYWYCSGHARYGKRSRRGWCSKHLRGG